MQYLDVDMQLKEWEVSRFSFLVKGGGNQQQC